MAKRFVLAWSSTVVGRRPQFLHLPNRNQPLWNLISKFQQESRQQQRNSHELRRSSTEKPLHLQGKNTLESLVASSVPPPDKFPAHLSIMDSSSQTVTDVAGASSATLLNWALSALVKLGTASLGVLVIVGGILYVKQESLLYFPEIGGMSKSPAGNPRGYRSPAERQIPFESHTITTEDGVQIHAWLLLLERRDPDSSTASAGGSNHAQRKANKGVPTIIFFHGNAGNIGLRLPNAIQMRHYLNANILMVEYRGYGNSEPGVKIDEAGLRKDAEAAYRFCLNHPTIDPNALFVFGRSLGGAVAFHLADYVQKNHAESYPPLVGVMVENTFISIATMVDHLMPFLAPFKSLVLRMDWDSSKVVPTLETPTLYLAGARDELVPHQHMLELVRLQQQPAAGWNGALKRMVVLHVIPNGTHNETWLQGGPAYWDAMKNFMRQALQRLSNQISSTEQQATAAKDAASSLDHTDYTHNPRTECNADDATSNTTPESSIPIMPKNFVDMAFTAMTGDSATNANSAAATANSKKDKKSD